MLAKRQDPPPLRCNYAADVRALAARDGLAAPHGCEGNPGTASTPTSAPWTANSLDYTKAQIQAVLPLLDPEAGGVLRAFVFNLPRGDPVVLCGV